MEWLCFVFFNFNPRVQAAALQFSARYGRRYDETTTGCELQQIAMMLGNNYSRCILVLEGASGWEGSIRARAVGVDRRRLVPKNLWEHEVKYESAQLFRIWFLVGSDRRSDRRTKVQSAPRLVMGCCRHRRRRSLADSITIIKWVLPERYRFSDFVFRVSRDELSEYGIMKFFLPRRF